MSNILDPDQARRPDCLPRLSAGDAGKQKVNIHGGEARHLKKEIPGYALR